ncbi:MAG: ABC transporter ATP-binding protein [Euryarchaeota archaeon]|nr:ABC transporter ATP-binding protein [Euryarchaeota archaeon]
MPWTSAGRPSPRATGERVTGANVKIRSVSHTFTGTKGATEALTGVNLDVAAREFVVLVGPSGCGKSTLLYLVAGLTRQTQGTIEADGKAVDGPSAERIMVFQEAALFPWLDVRSNVSFGLKSTGVGRTERARRIDEALKLVELDQFAHNRIHELSGGMRQRVALARALVLKPRVLLMDEPFAALDAQVRENLQQELQRLWTANTPTIIFVTHDVREAAVLADRIVVMSHRPGTVKDVLPVGLPRPRAVDDHAVVDVAKRARDALSTEVKWQMSHEWEYE